MVSLKAVVGAVLSFLTIQSSALTIAGKPNRLIKPYKRAPLQDLVTWDEHSLFVRGERIMFFSGEFHPYRLPVPSLWLDVFQKIKSLGYSGVSFYVDWALLEGQRGSFTADGVFALEPFFDAASQAGIYLLARPGPYINAEVSGGGYPGWLQRITGVIRTDDQSYLDATQLYAQSIGAIIAKAQITNGGPVILFQPENEYSFSANGIEFPNREYFAYVEQQFRDAGIVVPFIDNDAAAQGLFAPGTGLGSVDIYGHDSYPLGFDCANPYTWPSGRLPTYFRSTHLQQSPSTPYSLVEFQGGAFDPWGGLGFDQCAVLLNYEFERVFYKNNYASGVTIFNIYMTYGGTNWGNLGHPGGYTSYDYGAVAKEDRLITREKYSEAKLEANFLKVSPAYLVGNAGTASNGSYTYNPALAVTPILSNTTNFYVVRHSAYESLDSTDYTLSVSTSAGNATIPQLGGSFTLNGRDSKIHVTDYDIGGIDVLYSSAEVFTWEKYDSKTVLVLYGGAGETHETAFKLSTFSSNVSAEVTEGSGVQTAQQGGAVILNWEVTPERKVVSIGDELEVYLLWRNDAYNYWALELPSDAVGNYTSPSKTKVIAKAGYLLRTATLSGDDLYLTGDINSTTTVEVIGSPSSGNVYFNGEQLDSSNTVTFTPPQISIPSLGSLTWKSIDNLPELQSNYDDSAWTAATNTNSSNPRRLTTPTSLYASDYGYNTGSLIYRGRFTASGNESSFTITTQGGSAFGHSLFLNGTVLGSWPGIDRDENYNQTVTLPNLSAGSTYILTVVIDHMGLDENFNPGSDEMKNPRGILNYNLAGQPQSALTWKLTGNFGGESYADKTRGPLNEGAFFAERQGYHLPNPPTADWETSSPLDGIASAGAAFYSTSFDLDLPTDYDIPLSFVFANTTAAATKRSLLSTRQTGNSTASGFNYRCQLFVNGWQFGKYVHNIGPQDTYPVPEGILNYHGTNYVGLSLWALDAEGAKVDGLELVSDGAVLTSYGDVGVVESPAYAQREGAY
ncbi:MAG: hypothetical protein Q9160_006317 [Pyrenula sp. 1 TL-2023]